MLTFMTMVAGHKYEFINVNLLSDRLPQSGNGWTRSISMEAIPIYQINYLKQQNICLKAKQDQINDTTLPCGNIEKIFTRKSIAVYTAIAEFGDSHTTFHITRQIYNPGRYSTALKPLADKMFEALLQKNIRALQNIMDLGNVSIVENIEQEQEQDSTDVTGVLSVPDTETNAPDEVITIARPQTGLPTIVQEVSTDIVVDMSEDARSSNLTESEITETKVALDNPATPLIPALTPKKVNRKKQAKKA